MQRLEKERAKQERIDKERTEKELLEKERSEKERQDKERAEQERIEKERTEQERIYKERAESALAQLERLVDAGMQSIQMDPLDMQSLEWELPDQQRIQAHAQRTSLDVSKLPVEIPSTNKALPSATTKVFPHGDRDPVHDNAAFQDANPLSSDDSFDTLNVPHEGPRRVPSCSGVSSPPSCPPTTRPQVINPLYSQDPITVNINHVDQPVPRIKKTIRELLPKEDSDYIFALDEFVKYTRVMGQRFWNRMFKSIETR
jgi:hypothetical protein